MEKTVHLQGIGTVQAAEAENLKQGSVIMWSYGYTSEVLAVSPRGNRQITVTLKNESGTFNRVFNRSRLVAFESL